MKVEFVLNFVLIDILHNIWMYPFDIRTNKPSTYQTISSNENSNLLLFFVEAIDVGSHTFGSTITWRNSLILPEATWVGNQAYNPYNFFIGLDIRTHQPLDKETKLDFRRPRTFSLLLGDLFVKTPALNLFTMEKGKIIFIGWQNIRRMWLIYKASNFFFLSDQLF